MVGVRAGVGAGEDRGRGLATEGIQRDRRVTAGEEASPARLDEVPDERPVLVERRPAARIVLLEDERDLGALLEIAAEEREGSKAEAAQG